MSRRETSTRVASASAGGEDATGAVRLDLAELVAEDLHVVPRPAAGIRAPPQQRPEDETEAAERDDRRDHPEEPVCHPCLVP